jgi:hypothetical protein
MKLSHFSRLAIALALLAGPAAAQTPEASLLDALSLISGGLLAPKDPPPEVTHDGGLYHVRVPLPALTAPPNAAIEATARPVANGAWDIDSLALPPTGSLTIQGKDSSPPGVMTYAIGQQAFHATIDPSLSVPSPFKAELGHIILRTEATGQHADQTIERYGLEGTLSGDADRHLNVRARGSLANWLITGRSDKPDTGFRTSIRSVALRYDLDGLDRARAERLRAAAQAFSAERRDAMAAAPDGRMPGLTPAALAQLDAMIDALGGLMTRVKLDETIQGVHFEASDGDSVDIGSIRLGMVGDAHDGRLTAYFDIGLSDPAASMVPMEYASYMPRRVVIRPTLSGVRTDALLRLLRDAAADGGNLVELQSRVLALLDEPGVRAGIENLLVEAGPLRLEGWARLRPRPDGPPGFDIHLAATGLDAMIGTLQQDPGAMQVLPMVFIAKGMAKPQGDRLVWDIAFNGSGVVVNGAPFGQDQPVARPPARRR